LKISPDTNVLLRAFVKDDARQSEIAVAELEAASAIALSSTALSEFVWVLTMGYKFDRATAANFIRELLESGKILANWPALEAGLAALDQGGDFADAVIEIEGRQLGADIFLSFDSRAVKIANLAGRLARVPGSRKARG
jgi:predicted nucleic-acid-binding protein